ncbi:AAA family ATPase [Burkholderia gladioli]|uniref:AAA family ATPase n=1 Tax=Burkholderia gladioli TaxID=28095 RepID=UPI001C5F8C93|nr:ATP-binding protein [Burkholderia gladioli]MBW5284194.1 ATP-binding protein [Burkholderia gladioli]
MSTATELAARQAADVSVAARKPAAAVREAKANGAKKALAMLPDLVDAMLWNRREDLQSKLVQLAEALEESHPTIVRRLRRHGTVSTLKPATMPPKDLIHFDQARFGFEAVVLPEYVELQCRAICAEHERADELAKFDVTPRHRILLSGTPGNGKTMLAEAFARELDLPLLRVRYSGLMESHFGETGKNIAKIFEYAATAPCLLFFDEFDTVSTARGRDVDVGEARRITNQLLMSLDTLPPYCVLTAATNMLVDLDPAVLRRFDFRIELGAPTADLRLRIAKMELDPAHTPGVDISHLAEKLAPQPFVNMAELVKRCREIRRDMVLNKGNNVGRLVCAQRGASAADQAYREELEARGQLRIAST